MQKFVTFVLDQSGSMGEIRGGVNMKAKAIEGFNAYVKGLRESDPAAAFTFILFNTNAVEVRHRAIPMRDVPYLGHETYKPSAGTPLIDAVMKAIKATEEKAPASAPVVIAIQTDGEENSSVEFTMEHLNEEVKKKTAAGWLFTFIGANMDAYAQASKMGVQAAHTMSYAGANTVSAFDSMNRSTQSYLSANGGVRGQMVASFTVEERTAGGLEIPPAPQAAAPKTAIVDDIKI